MGRHAASKSSTRKSALLSRRVATPSTSIGRVHHDGWPCSTRSGRGAWKIDALVATVEAQNDPFVVKALLHHSLARTDLVHQIDRTLFEHTRFDDGFDVVTAVFFQNRRVDALQVQDVSMRRSGSRNLGLEVGGSLAALKIAGKGFFWI